MLVKNDFSIIFKCILRIKEKICILPHKWVLWPEQRTYQIFFFFYIIMSCTIHNIILLFKLLTTIFVRQWHPRSSGKRFPLQILYNSLHLTNTTLRLKIRKFQSYNGDLTPSSSALIISLFHCLCGCLQLLGTLKLPFSSY